jgi:SPP1 family predicted phage head-tail adaptor
MWKDIVTLRTETIGQDADGYPTTTYEDTEVWANKKSVTRSEFYASNANGIDLKYVFEIRSEDYNDQKYIIHDTKHYEVIRAYQKGEGTVELACSDKAV